MTCMVAGAKLVKQLKGMYKYSGVKSIDNCVIVRLDVIPRNNKEFDLEFAACLGQVDIRPGHEKVGNKWVLAYNTKVSDVAEMYYLSCEMLRADEFEPRDFKPVYFELTQSLIQKLDRITAKMPKLYITVTEFQILFSSELSTYMKNAVTVTRVFAKYAKDVKPVNIANVKSLARGAKVLEMSHARFVGLFYNYMNEAIGWVMSPRKVDSDLYISNDFVYKFRTAYAVRIKDKSFSPIVNLIEQCMYNYGPMPEYSGLYRIPCYIVARLAEVAIKANTTVKITVLAGGLCNVSFVVDNTEKFVWSWLQDKDSFLKMQEILEGYQLSAVCPESAVRQTMIDVSSNALLEVARIGVAKGKLIPEGTVVYTDEQGKLRVKPVNYVDKRLYVEDVERYSVPNTCNFPNVAINTAYLRNLIKVLLKGAKTGQFKMTVIPVKTIGFTVYKALYLQTVDREITVVLLPVLLNKTYKNI